MRRIYCIWHRPALRNNWCSADWCCRASWDKNVKIARPPTKHAMPTASGQILTEISGLLDVRQISGNHASLKWSIGRNLELLLLSSGARAEAGSLPFCARE